ncbi:hypothetical protein Bbelb_200990 [Branchiostoma belcheri]|nr:hypothetical protein Bbelb_200990 [Branchiostoma belcheri]
MGPDVVESSGTPLVSANSAANTLDGNTATYWAPSPADGSYGSVLYDLRQPYWVYYIRVTNYGDGSHYVTSFTLESSETGQDYTTAANFTFTQSAAVGVFDGFFARGRYWRFTVTGVVGGGEPWVAGIQLYGTPGWVRPLGCWADSSSRAIQPLEGTDPLLSDAYGSRQQALYKCYTVSRGLGYDVFALQAGGWCASIATARETYQMYGASSACQADGEGGGWANEVYEIIGGARRSRQHSTKDDTTPTDIVTLTKAIQQDSRTICCLRRTANISIYTSRVMRAPNTMDGLKRVLETVLQEKELNWGRVITAMSFAVDVCVNSRDLGETDVDILSNENLAWQPVRLERSLKEGRSIQQTVVA